MTYTDININSASYRLTQPRRQPTRDEEIKHLQRYLAEMGPAGFGWTQTFQAAERRLAELDAARRAEGAE